MKLLWGKTIEKKSFYRRMLGSGVLKKTEEMRKNGHRPAKLYRLINKEKAHYFTRSIGF